MTFSCSEPTQTLTDQVEGQMIQIVRSRIKAVSEMRSLRGSAPFEWQLPKTQSFGLPDLKKLVQFLRRRKPVGSMYFNTIAWPGLAQRVSLDDFVNAIKKCPSFDSVTIFHSSLEFENVLL